MSVELAFAERAKKAAFFFANQELCYTRYADLPRWNGRKLENARREKAMTFRIKNIPYEISLV